MSSPSPASLPAPARSILRHVSASSDDWAMSSHSFGPGTLLDLVFMCHVRDLLKYASSTWAPGFSSEKSMASSYPNMLPVSFFVLLVVIQMHHLTYLKVDCSGVEANDSLTIFS